MNLTLNFFKRFVKAKLSFIALFSLSFYSLQGTEAMKNQTEEAIFAGGCFWCVQHDFDTLKGVVATTAGYCGGKGANPTYKEVSAGGTGHLESVRVEYDPTIVSYQELLVFYFHNVDPTRNDGQFCDTGRQYRPVIFYTNQAQKALAEKYKDQLLKEGKVSQILVDILPATTFYPAEEYHQKYAENNPLRYKFYRFNCGRDKRLKEVWGSN